MSFPAVGVAHLMPGVAELDGFLKPQAQRPATIAAFRSVVAGISFAILGRFAC
jgi:hypothetical protein